jgi:hypothetical protein
VGISVHTQSALFLQSRPPLPIHNRPLGRTRVVTSHMARVCARLQADASKLQKLTTELQGRHIVKRFPVGKGKGKGFKSFKGRCRGAASKAHRFCRWCSVRRP